MAEVGYTLWDCLGRDMGDLASMHGIGLVVEGVDMGGPLGELG